MFNTNTFNYEVAFNKAYDAWYSTGRGATGTEWNTLEESEQNKLIQAQIEA